MVGAETVAVCITDGGTDWTACEDMVRAKFPWIHFLYCADHLLSLILKDICSIEEVNTMHVLIYFFILTIYIMLCRLLSWSTTSPVRNIG